MLILKRVLFEGQIKKKGARSFGGKEMAKYGI